MQLGVFSCAESLQPAGRDGRDNGRMVAKRQFSLASLFVALSNGSALHLFVAQGLESCQLFLLVFFVSTAFSNLPS